MMRSDFDCKLAQDLLPLYLEGKTCKASNSFLQDHMDGCAECKEIYEWMQAEYVDNENAGNKEISVGPGNLPHQKKRASVTDKLALLVLGYFIVIVIFLILFGYFMIWGF